jgi:hypothetical protein
VLESRSRFAFLHVTSPPNRATWPKLSRHCHVPGSFRLLLAGAQLVFKHDQPVLRLDDESGKRVQSDACLFAVYSRRVVGHPASVLGKRTSLEIPSYSVQSIFFLSCRHIELTSSHSLFHRYCHSFCEPLWPRPFVLQRRCYF